ncbi:INO80 complex subunit C-like [Hydractinia symbiolongicarpus]|uniref:INO80 complex subunit C-like n=1 Tax=Hydractinia symbiolongicarpus TaxID=13093 RepID=UPI00254CC1CD|nr:INO80 complex subunit C-like [Hydractinia symbiolongicarpus]
MSKRSSLSRQESLSKIKKKDASTGGEGDIKTSNVIKFQFKNQNFQHSGDVRSGKKKSWKGLRQVALSEKTHSSPDGPTYLRIDSPPPLKPAKKYSDITGQLAKYTDPETGLYYASAEEYKQIKRLPPDVVQGYLALRNVNQRM